MGGENEHDNSDLFAAALERRLVGAGYRAIASAVKMFYEGLLAEGVTEALAESWTLRFMETIVTKLILGPALDSKEKSPDEP